MPNGLGTRGGQGGNGGGAGGTRTSPGGGSGSALRGSGGGGPGSGDGGLSSGAGGDGGNGGSNGSNGPALPTAARQGGDGSGGINAGTGAGGGGGGAGGYGAIAGTNGTLSVSLIGGAGGNGGGGGNDDDVKGGVGGNGGGGGGGLSFGGTSLTVGAAATLQGGAGGTGGRGGDGSEENMTAGGAGGGGGAGGDGLELTGTAATAVTNAGTISGGAGGTGGSGGNGYFRDGDGDGGDGGNGINVIGPAATTLTNSGTISGGIGGASDFASAGRNGAGVYGANLTITNTGTISGGGAGAAQANAITFAGGANSLTPGTGTLNGNIAVDGTSTTLAVKASGATTLGNTITGSGSLTFGSSAASVITLTGANTYTGRTTIASGTVVAKTATALGSSADFTQVNSGATLKIEGAGLTFNENIVIYGSGVGNGGALRNVGTGDPAGTNNVNNILLGSASRINSDAGILQINGLITAPNLNLTFGGAGITYAFQTIQTGTGTLTKDGTGIVALYGSNAYTGTTTVSNGLLDLLNGNAIDNSGAVVIKAPGGLRLFNSERVGSIAGSGNITLFNSTLTVGDNNSSTSFSGTIGDFDGTHTGKFEKTGTGTLTLSGANSYSGYTYISAGTLKLSNTSTTSAVASLGRDVIYVFSGAVLEIANSDRNEGEFTIANSIVEGGSLKLSGPNGAYTVMRGANSYTGGTTIASGIVEIGDDSALGTGRVTMTGGAIRAIDSAKTLANAFTLSGTIGVGFATDITGAIDLAANTILTPSLNAGSTWSGPVTLGSFALSLANSGPNSAGATWAGAALTISGQISGSGRVIQGSAGTLILSGANAYTGGTTIKAGTISIGDAGALGTGTVGFTGTGGTLTATFTGTISNNVVVSAGATAKVGASAGETLTLGGVVSGSGALQTSTGTLRLTGADTISGGIRVSAGTTLALADAGSLANAAVTMAANSNLDISGVTTQTRIKDLTGANATSTVTLGSKQLTVTQATDDTRVKYVSAAGQSSRLVINVASANFSLANASFASWTKGEDTITVNGNAGVNQLNGSSLSDILQGNAGDDRLSGGLGADTFVYHAGFGKDTITDFTAGTGTTRDTIQIDRSIFADFGTLFGHTTDTANGAVITADANNTITLTGVAMANLTESNFTFV